MQKLNIKYQKYISKILMFVSIFFILQFTFSFFILSEAKAHCPLCVAGAAAGVTLTRWIGVDDSITGIWIGALLGSMSLWIFVLLLTKSEKLRKWKYRYIIKSLIYIVIFASTLWSFYQFKLIIRMSQLFGLDKLTFGMILGAVTFYILDLIKIKHYFPYQKIVISLGSMTILSLMVYILINFFI